MAVQDLMEEAERSRREAMLRNMLDLDQFRTAVRTGALRPITLRAGGFQFWIEGQPRPQPGIKPGADTLLTLCTSRSKRPRWFRNPAAALELLREMGATTVQVELGHWYPRQAKEMGKKRPDMAARLAHAHREARDEAIRSSRFGGEATMAGDWQDDL
jgi:hypothetical protein